MERDGLDVGFTSFAFSTDGRFPNLVASPKNSSFLLSGLRAEALKGRFNTLITYLKFVIQLCQLSWEQSRIYSSVLKPCQPHREKPAQVDGASCKFSWKVFSLDFCPWITQVRQYCEDSAAAKPCEQFVTQGLDRTSAGAEHQINRMKGD